MGRSHCDWCRGEVIGQGEGESASFASCDADSLPPSPWSSFKQFGDPEFSRVCRPDRPYVPGRDFDGRQVLPVSRIYGVDLLAFENCLRPQESQATQPVKRVSVLGSLLGGK